MDDLNALVERIMQFDDAQISEVIQAVIRRYKRVYPGQEVVFLSLPAEPAEERSRCIDALIAMLKKE